MSEKTQKIEKILRATAGPLTHYAVYREGERFKLCKPNRKLSGSCVAKKGKAAQCKYCRRIRDD